MIQWGGTCGQNQNHWGTSPSEIQTEHLLQHCQLHDALRRDMWPEPKPLRDKPFRDTDRTSTTALPINYMMLWDGTCGQNRNHWGTSPSEIQTEHLLQHCQLHDALRRDMWPEPKPLRDKLFRDTDRTSTTALPINYMMLWDGTCGQNQNHLRTSSMATWRS